MFAHKNIGMIAFAFSAPIFLCGLELIPDTRLQVRDTLEITKILIRIDRSRCKNCDINWFSLRKIYFNKHKEQNYHNFDKYYMSFWGISDNKNVTKMSAYRMDQGGIFVIHHMSLLCVDARGQDLRNLYKNRPKIYYYHMIEPDFAIKPGRCPVPAERPAAVSMAPLPPTTPAPATLSPD